MSVSSLEVVTLQVQLSAPVCALLCAIFLIWIVVGIFVYKDAKSRGMSGIAWFLVALLFPLIGIIIYLVVRGDLPQRYAYPPPETAPTPPGPPTKAGRGGTIGYSCPRCGSSVPFDAAYCPSCGTRMA